MDILSASLLANSSIGSPDNELPLLTDRVTYYKNCPDDSIPSDFDPGSIFNSLPAFSLDDPVGVLIVEISGSEDVEYDATPIYAI